MSRFVVGMICSLMWVLLPACSFRLVEVKYVPPAPQPRSAPQKPATGNDPEVSLVQLLTEQSKEETKNGTKSLQLNGQISPEFAAATGLGPENCIQAVTFSTGDVVADFADTACPANGGLVPESNIKFSLFFDMSTNELYIDEVSSLGVATVDPNPANPSASLTELCSGPYASNCTLKVGNGKFTDLTLP